MDHRCFLPADHKWRHNKSFNGKVETRGPPKKLSGSEILEQVKDLEGMKFGKTTRHDLKHVKIMKHLAPKLIDGKWHMPPVPYTLSKAQKLTVYKFLEDIKVPDGYSSNFSKCINLEMRKIWGLKTHDCHVLLEELLPLAIRGVSSSKVYEVTTLPESEDQVVKDLKTLALGSFRGFQCFGGYLANGFSFHTKDIEKKRKNQNSGVMVKGIAESKNIDYFGVLNDIIMLQYLEGKRVILFRCDWWDVHKISKGVKIDKCGVVSVNTKYIQDIEGIVEDLNENADNEVEMNKGK
uniref:DUF4216 domain-containing protein n=1 Tax=Chenopodium quinoa TaxID=63459 RepID=A0A803MQZ1_CHEQI